MNTSLYKSWQSAKYLMVDYSGMLIQHILDAHIYYIYLSYKYKQYYKIV